MDIKQTLKQLTEAAGVSGYEHAVRRLTTELLTPLGDQVRQDAMGNVIALKRGAEPAPGRIMLASHMDEIGLIVSKLDRGFLRFSQVGGFDPRVLPGQEVIVHGQEPLPGIIASRPPHVLSTKERKQVTPIHKLFIDIGLPHDRLADLVSVGDLITIKREALELQNGLMASKAVDDRASVAAILAALHDLQTIQHTWDVYAVATVQEEVGLKGAMTSTYNVNPDVGIALDVTFATQPGVKEEESIKLDKGCGIAQGPNIHPKVFHKLVSVAKKYEIPHQIEVPPGATGTDAWAMQVTRAGIPTALISIPIRNMHTSVEMLSFKDVERTGRLLAHFIRELDDGFLETLKLK
ncbi:MAG: putative aminopeptidase YsdC [Anaerolineales bacterium]|nr:putative aminopeptidase YsdC [Anaerolineales bacterium]